MTKDVSHRRSGSSAKDPRRATRILLVDPDREYGEIINDTLSREPYSVTLAASAAEALAQIRARPHELVIIEAGERLQESIDLGREFSRLRPGGGMVFTSPQRLPMAETLALYAAGADDLIEKPFHPMVFVMRIAAVVRRVRGASAAIGLEEPVELLELDTRARTARYAGHTLKLTVTEFLLLMELMQANGAVVSYSRLNTRLLGDMQSDDGAGLKTHVYSLRRKLCAAGAEPSTIRTERCVGYALNL